MATLSTLFERFLKERRFLKNVTPKTLSWYQSSFLAFTRTVDVPDAAQLTQSVLKRFVVGLREQGLEPVSCNTYVKAINAFLMWLHAEGHLGERLKMSLQRTERKVVATLKEQDLKHLLGFKPRTTAQWRAYTLRVATAGDLGAVSDAQSAGRLDGRPPD